MLRSLRECCTNKSGGHASEIARREEASDAARAMLGSERLDQRGLEREEHHKERDITQKGDGAALVHTTKPELAKDYGSGEETGHTSSHVLSLSEWESILNLEADLRDFHRVRSNHLHAASPSTGQHATNS